MKVNYRLSCVINVSESKVRCLNEIQMFENIIQQFLAWGSALFRKKNK